MSMKKLMVITSRFPYPLDKGDKLRAYHQIKQFSKHTEVHLISLTNQSIDSECINELKQFCASVSVYRLSKLESVLSMFNALVNKNPFQVALFYNNSIHKKIKRKVREINPDHIYCQLVRCAEYVKSEFDIPKTIDFMDVLSKGIERRITTSPFYLKKILEIEAERLKVYEHIMFEYFDNHSIISVQDQELIYHIKRESISVIPNGIDTNYFLPKQKAEKKYTLLFNGNMQYQPNVKSAVYIATEILPIVHKTNPEITLLISGTSPTREVQDLANERIIVSGWMDDIRDAYNSSQIFIAPMQIGTGLQNKLLEAMAMKMPCISSKLANNALKATPDEEILIGNSKEEYAKLILELIKNPAQKTSIGQNGHNYVTSNFNWESSSEKIMIKMNLIE
jgi:polysaccharide biosynthesis protein PslH